MFFNMKVTQTIKKKVKYKELDALCKKMFAGGYRLACVMPEMVHTYSQGDSGEYTLPTTVLCVFERWETKK